MTSQVVVLNQRGVAVASDTVVTTLHGGRPLRTFANQAKLVPLGSSQNVVIALAGDVSANGVDISLLLSEWRKHCTDSLGELPDYVTSFQNWLRADTWPISQESQVSTATGILLHYFTEIRDGVAALRDDTVTKKAVELFSLAACVDDHYTSLLEEEHHSGATDESDAAWMNSASIDTDELINTVFDQRWDHLKADVEEARPGLRKLAPLVLSRIRESDSGAELTFVGYGSHDFFPRAIKVGFLGRYGDSDRIWTKEEVDHTSGVLTMAQSSAVMGFMNGVSDDAADLLKSMLHFSLSSSFKNPPDGHSSIRAFVDDLTQRWLTLLNDSKLTPLLDTIGSLSLRDIAELAESLVGIQALRANASTELPTVGGFIESLVIDRYEGVRWISRLPR